MLNPNQIQPHIYDQKNMECQAPVTPALIQQIYAKHGKQISLELAAKILTILEKIADLSHQVYSKTTNENP